MNPFIRLEIPKILLGFIIWRLLLFLVAAISPQIISEFGAKFPYYQERLIASNLPHFIWSFGNFDGVHYLGIAKDGYAYQYTQAFFPFYPILIKGLSLITFNSFLISALLISNFAFLIGLMIFYKLIKEKFDAKIALWSSLFLLAFPTSFYFGAIYTEGLFFLMLMSTFYLIEKGKTWQAYFVGTFASATRLIGVFLLPVFILERNSKSFWPILIVPIGFMAYVLYLKITFDNPFYFLTSQQIFGQGRSSDGIVLLPQVFWRYFKILATTNGMPFFNAALELFSTVFALLLLAVAYKKKFDRQWLIFSGLAVLIPTLTGTLTSMPRYILVAFPMYIVLASIKSSIIKKSFLGFFLVLLVFLTILFTQGYWVA